MKYRIVLKSRWDLDIEDQDDVGAVFIERKYWWWQLKSAGNGAVLAHSETYRSKAKALKTAEDLAASLKITVET